MNKSLTSLSTRQIGGWWFVTAPVRDFKEFCCRPGPRKLNWLAGPQKGFCRYVIKTERLRSVPGNLPAPRAGPEYQVFTQTHESFKVKNAMTCSQ